MQNTKKVLVCLAIAAGAFASPGCVVVMKKDKHQKMVDQLAQTQDLLDKAGKELTGAKADLTETKGLLAKAQKDLTDARTEQAKERKTLQTDLQAAKSQKAKLTIELTKLRLAGKDSAQAAADANKTVAKLTADLAKKTQEAADLQKKLTDQQKAVAQLTKSVADLENKLAELKKAAVTAPAP